MPSISFVNVPTVRTLRLVESKTHTLTTAMEKKSLTLLRPKIYYQSLMNVWGSNVTRQSPLILGGVHYGGVLLEWRWSVATHGSTCAENF